MGTNFTQEPAFELLPLFRERVWGRTSLKPLFPEISESSSPDTNRIGEVWFTFTENETSTGKKLGALLASSPHLLGTAADPKHPAVCPILVKFLFTTERLSVQVHPDDAYAWEHHQSLGKTEAWYVVEAEPDGEVGIGFTRDLTRSEFRESIATGDIEHLLAWRHVKRGDIVFTPAGTVHAVGAGVVICEIQENSDITYRLYDYGRPRELHLDHGERVSQLRPHSIWPEPRELAPGRDELVACEYFRIERLRPARELRVTGELDRYAIAICTSGAREHAGRAWFVPAGNSDFRVEAPGSEWIVTYRADAPLKEIEAA